MKAVVDINCLISSLGPPPSRALALASGLDHACFQDRLRRVLLEAFRSGTLIATKALRDDLSSKSGLDGQGKHLVNTFLAELQKLGVHFESIKSEDSDLIGELTEAVQGAFEEQHADGFLRGNDYQYIVIARRLDAFLATTESQAVPHIQRNQNKIAGKPKIPYIAWRFGVRTVGLYYVLQHLGMGGDSAVAPC